MNIKQISVFLENKPGALLSLTDTLAANRIDMRALSLAETSDFGIVRIIVNDVYATSTVLKDAGFVYSVTSVLGVCIPDEPGSLHKILEVLKDAGINVEYIYAFLSSDSPDHAYMIFKVPDHKVAAAALRTKGIQTIDQEEIEKL